MSDFSFYSENKNIFNKDNIVYISDDVSKINISTPGVNRGHSMNQGRPYSNRGYSYYYVSSPENSKWYNWSYDGKIGEGITWSSHGEFILYDFPELGGLADPTFLHRSNTNHGNTRHKAVNLDHLYYANGNPRKYYVAYRSKDGEPPPYSRYKKSSWYLASNKYGMDFKGRSTKYAILNENNDISGNIYINNLDWKVFESSDLETIPAGYNRGTYFPF